MASKGGKKVGYGPKLTWHDVKVIRYWLSKGYTRKVIAEAFKVHMYTVRDIAGYRTWAWLGNG